MLFDNSLTNSTLQVLQLLRNGKSRYSILFKNVKFSHETIQTSLKFLVEKEFVKKDEKGYEILEKGEKLLKILLNLKELLN